MKGQESFQQAGTTVYHPEGHKRLGEAVQDFQLTMQHALRQNLSVELQQRALDEAGVLPPLTPGEMFDYLIDTDSEFVNYCFPYCAFVLDKDKLGYLHLHILQQFRRSLDPAQESVLESVDQNQ